jgi:hypothetical protein
MGVRRNRSFPFFICRSLRRRAHASRENFACVRQGAARAGEMAQTRPRTLDAPLPSWGAETNLHPSRYNRTMRQQNNAHTSKANPQITKVIFNRLPMCVAYRSGLPRRA